MHKSIDDTGYYKQDGAYKNNPLVTFSIDIIPKNIIKIEEKDQIVNVINNPVVIEVQIADKQTNLVIRGN